MIRVAINGYGRIGRILLRNIYENYKFYELFKIVAINDSFLNIKNIFYAIKYDSNYGIFSKYINIIDNKIFIEKDEILFLSENNIENLPWNKLKVDIVFECTGKHISKISCKKHIFAGCKKVLVSSPGDDTIKQKIVYGINNENIYNENIISNASCTTNCLAPIVKILDDYVGIKKAYITSIHASTNDQKILDNNHLDIRRSRSVSNNIIPTTTGAIETLNFILPKFKNLIQGISIRIPVQIVSMLDCVFYIKKNTSTLEIKQMFSDIIKQKIFKEILSINKDLLVSSDFKKNTYAAVIDFTLLIVDKNFIKISLWYDNEWGFSNQMLRTASIMF